MSAETKEIAPAATETVANAPEAHVQAQEDPRSKKRDENFRKMEQKLRETEERLRAVEDEKRAATNQHSASDDADLVTMGQARKVIEQEARRIAEETLKKRELEGLGDRLQTKYADFNDVVSEDAIESLREEHPEIFSSLRSNPDPYQKGIAAYKFIKSMNKKDNSKANEKKIEENRTKPNMAASTGSVLSQATGWQKPSAQQKAAAYADMKQSASKRS